MAPEKILILAITGSLLFVVLCAGVFKFFLLSQRKKAQQLARENLHRQQILQTQLEIQQQTFQNVSREIHDNIGQVLSLIKLNLNSVSVASQNQPYHTKVATTLDLTSQVIRDLRHLSKGLNPDFVQQLGLTGCLEFELERLQNSAPYATHLAVSGEPYRLPFSKDFIIYRVVQECLNNIIKHAQAQTIHIDCRYSPGELNVSVTDDGRGFDVQSYTAVSAAAGGSGMHNMQQRMHMIGGRFHCHSQPGGGTVIQLAVSPN
jgi:two-component system, NarL family, sensor kinase